MGRVMMIISVLMALGVGVISIWDPLFMRFIRASMVERENRPYVP